MRDGALIHVSSGSRLDAPIDLISISTSAASGRAMRPRHLIVLEQGAEATLVERYLSLHDAAYFNNLVCEVLLQEGASLVHQRVQQESPLAYHLADLHIGLQAEASYRGVNLAMGGAWARTLISNSFTAQGASCELHGLYLAGEGQLVDFHLDVDHAVPGCVSRENFKGILYGNGRAVFDGRILVRDQAQKSSAHLSNANLMLSRRAEVDTKPQLEILADDVLCSHGTTVGQIDPQALFYLRSRGLSEAQARRLLCLGFASEILEQFQSASLQDHLAGVIQQKIGSEPNETA
jgi:Fe-S cluster assembly protein SufD